MHVTAQTKMKLTPASLPDKPSAETMRSQEPNGGLSSDTPGSSQPLAFERLLCEQKLPCRGRRGEGAREQNRRLSGAKRLQQEQYGEDTFLFLQFSHIFLTTLITLFFVHTVYKHFFIICRIHVFRNLDERRKLCASFLNLEIYLSQTSSSFKTLDWSINCKPGCSCLWAYLSKPCQQHPTKKDKVVASCNCPSLGAKIST